MNSNTLKKRTSTFKLFLAIAAALSMCTNTSAEIEYRKVGDPLWEPSESVMTSFRFETLLNAGIADQMQREATLNWLGSSHVLPDPLPDAPVLFPGEPHSGPYDNELRPSIAAQGGVITDVFTFEEIRNPASVLFTGVFVPSENAPLGPSPDSAMGPVIPNEIFPITRRLFTTRNGNTPNCSGCQPRSIESLDSYGTFVDTNGNEHDVSGLNWSHILHTQGGYWLSPNRSESRILGNYVQTERFRDVNRDGWDVSYRFSVRRSTGILGDLSYSDGLDMHDLDILTQNVAVGATNLRLDMNDDETVNVADIHYWVTDLKSTWIGDANLDGQFDNGDVVSVLQSGKFGVEQVARWNEGDWNGDELFDRADVIVALQDGGYGQGPRPASAVSGNGGAHAALTPSGVTGDVQTSIVYDAISGQLSVDAPVGVELTSINIDSVAGIFTGEAATNLGGSFDNDADNNIFKATFGGSFGSLSFGDVVQAGLTEEFVLGDLSVIGSLAGGGDLGNVDLVYVPEPATVLLLSVGLAIGLLHLKPVVR